MYKVFIYNSPVLFFNRTTKPIALTDNLVKLNLSDIYKHGILRIVKKNPEKTLWIECEDILTEFEVVFKGMRKIEAAGGFVQNKKGEHLYIYRNGVWDLPKGKLEENESLEEGAIREVEEECGIHGVISQGLLHRTFHVYKLKDEHILKPTYWYKMLYSGSESLSPQKEEGIEKAEWRNPKEIDDVLQNTFGSIRDVIEKGIKESTLKSKKQAS